MLGGRFQTVQREPAELPPSPYSHSYPIGKAQHSVAVVAIPAFAFARVLDFRLAQRRTPYTFIDAEVEVGVVIEFAAVLLRRTIL